MKVHAVSFSFSGIKKRDKQENNYPFMYTADLAHINSKHDSRKFKVST